MIQATFGIAYYWDRRCEGISAMLRRTSPVACTGIWVILPVATPVWTDGTWLSSQRWFPRGSHLANDGAAPAAIGAHAFGRRRVLGVSIKVQPFNQPKL